MVVVGLGSGEGKIPIPLTNILTLRIVWMEAGNPQMQM